MKISSVCGAVLVLGVLAAWPAAAQDTGTAAPAAGTSAVAETVPAADTAANTPLPVPGVDIGAYAFRMLMYLLVLIIVGWGVLYLVRRYLMPASAAGGLQKSVRVLGQVPLGPRKSLIIVEIAGRVVVLGATDHHVGAVAEISDSGAVETVKSEFQEGFHHQFSQYLGKMLGGRPSGKGPNA